MSNPTPLDLQDIAQALQARKHALEQEVAAAEAEIDASTHQSPEEPEDVAQRQEAQEVRLGEIARDRSELASIGRALARIDVGDYGICIDCGQPIAKERLLARPESTLCLPCKQAREAREARA